MRPLLRPGRAVGPYRDAPGTARADLSGSGRVGVGPLLAFEAGMCLVPVTWDCAAADPGVASAPSGKVPVIGDRYEVAGELARGGMGTVLRAVDRATGRPVAIKRPRSLDPQLIERARREVLALRLLQVPGVVQLVDDGEDEDGVYLVTQLVEGLPFPGVFREPEALAVVTRRLLDVLGRVHAIGIVHRDLKPGNVLVDAAGQVHVLDFGIARGQPLGQTLTADGAVIGTPRYLAPEQVAGDPVDARTDLFALGVMLYEVLGGQSPFPDSLVGRVLRDAPPIADRAPACDPRLARLVDRLLARVPSQRPASAADALAMLAVGGQAPRLRFAGSRAAVDTLVAAAEAGRPMDLRGAPGLGRTRVLAEAAAVLEARGRTLVRVVAGERPLAAIRASFGLPDQSPAELEAALRVRLADAVLIVDPPTALDRWSRQMLLDLGGAQLGLGAEAVELAPLTEADLRELFWGPDKVLHLREDGAAELYRRSGGHPGRVDAVVADWLGRGLVQLDGDRIRVAPGGVAALEDAPAEAGWRAVSMDPAVLTLLPWVVLADGQADIQTLAAGVRRPAWEVELLVEELVEQGHALRQDARILPRPGAEACLLGWTEEARREAHRALAAAMESPSRRRLRHLVQAGELREAVGEGRALARQLQAEGRFGVAAHVLGTVWSAAKGALDPLVEVDLLGELTAASHASEDVRARQLAAEAVRRSRPVAFRLPELGDLAEASVALARRHLGVAEGLLDGVGEVPQEALELLRVTMRVEAVTRARAEDALALLAGLEAWASAGGDRRGRWLGWRGLALNRLGRFEEAAEAHAAAARLRIDPYGQMVAGLNEATARLDAGQIDVADEVAARVVDAAARRRLHGIELRARWVRRSADYRRCRRMEVDDDLVDAARLLALPAASGPVLFTEATVAWRAGDPRAAMLMRDARREFKGNAAIEVLADALLAALGSLEPESLATLPERIRNLPQWRPRVQAGALLGRLEPIDGIGRSTIRWEILSPSECTTGVTEAT